MRTKLLFDDVDASSNQTSIVVDFQKRAEWLISCRASGLDGAPKVIIEYSIDNDIVRFDALTNPNTCQPFFEFDEDGKLAVKDTSLQGSSFRVRLEPNGNTTGTVLIDLGYKTFP